jgi:hypothetical protein
MWTDMTDKTKGPFFYCCLAVGMAAGGTELRRFRVTEDPRLLGPEQQPGFFAWALKQLGIDPSGLAAAPRPRYSAT